MPTAATMITEAITTLGRKWNMGPAKRMVMRITIDATIANI